MDALLPPFVAAFLAEWGDRTQLLAVLLAARFGRAVPVLAAIAVAALLNSLLSAFAGHYLVGLINFRAITLMTALALLFAGVGALMPQRPPKLEGGGRGGAFLASLFAFAVLEFGDKTQFLTATLAARADSIWLPAIGATAGVILAATPAILLAERFRAAVPLRVIRFAVGLIFLLVGAIVALGALRLV
ncbi:MAG: TMEM165/GDT1 family protein [Sphingomonadaceae bacterium]